MRDTLRRWLTGQARPPTEARLEARILAELRHATFSATELQAVRGTAPLWQQLLRFYRQGGRVRTQPAAFAAANGTPTQITLYVPEDPVQGSCADAATLAHELGHALFCPEQWRDIASFSSAEAYARSREWGEAHAWLNQYRMGQARQDGSTAPVWNLWIESDHDFGTHQVDVFALLAQLEAAGADEQRLLQELALLNANMFPSGMGAHNFKTYGQCNRWDWLCATQTGRASSFQRFLDALPQPPHPQAQKLLMKLNQFTGAPSATPHAAPAPDLQQLAQVVAALPAHCELPALWACGLQALPGATCGIGRQPVGAIPHSYAAANSPSTA